MAAGDTAAGAAAEAVTSRSGSSHGSSWRGWGRGYVSDPTQGDPRASAGPAIRKTCRSTSYITSWSSIGRTGMRAGRVTRPRGRARSTLRPDRHFRTSKRIPHRCPKTARLAHRRRLNFSQSRADRRRPIADRAETAMRIDDETCYRALAARDPRFDGLFFVGVTTTRIYCRPICTARTAGRDRCRFFADAAMAEKGGFRPCLRCRPELAPGHAPVDAVGRTARIAAARIEAGALNDGGSVEKLARDLGLERAAAPPVGPVGVRRLADRAGPDAPAAPGQATAHRVGPADRRGSRSPAGSRASVGSMRLFQAHYRLTPTDMRRSPPKDHGPGLAPADAGLSAAHGLGRDDRLPRRGGRRPASSGSRGRPYLRTAAVGAAPGLAEGRADRRTQCAGGRAGHGAGARRCRKSSRGSRTSSTWPRGRT